MPTVIVHHEVEDYESFLAPKNRQTFLVKLGVTGIREFVDPA
ncbi:hypothetical protein [Methylibium petroleiphilum]